MLQITGYRLPFQPAPVLCPLCTLPPGNPRSVQLQPCCLYPAELCPESPVQLPVNSLVAVRSPSYQPYSISAKPISAMPFSLRQFQSSPIENVTRAQDARGSGVDDVTSNNGELKNISLTISAFLLCNFTGCEISKVFPITGHDYLRVAIFSIKYTDFVYRFPRG